MNPRRNGNGRGTRLTAGGQAADLPASGGLCASGALRGWTQIRRPAGACRAEVFVGERPGAKAKAGSAPKGRGPESPREQGVPSHRSKKDWRELAVE